MCTRNLLSSDLLLYSICLYFEHPRVEFSAFEALTSKCKEASRSDFRHKSVQSRLKESSCKEAFISLKEEVLAQIGPCIYPMIYMYIHVFTCTFLGLRKSWKETSNIRGRQVLE